MLTFKVITPTEIKDPEAGDTILTTKGWSRINKVTSEIYKALDYGIILGSSDHLVHDINGKVPLSFIRKKLLRYTTRCTFPVIEKQYALFLGIKSPIKKDFDLFNIDFDMSCTLLEKYSTKLSNYKNSVLHFSDYDDSEFIISALTAGYSIRPFNKFRCNGKNKISTSPAIFQKVDLIREVYAVGYEIDVEDYFMYYNGRMFIA